jgi:Methyltransferase small domain
VRRNGDEVAPEIRIVPHDELLVASDRRPVEGEQLPFDHVAGVHDPSVMLSHLTVRRHGGRTLDLGTGNGIQAMLSSQHSGSVLGTDVNERALAFAAFSAALNGCANIEWKAGSFFEPVAGEHYDLITTNPPYVISPESAYAFRDSGMEGDAVSRMVVERAPEFLAEDGFATMLVSWAVRGGEDDDVTAPLKEWVAGTGCDAWLLYYGTDDPVTHAAKWLPQDTGDDPDAHDAGMKRWLAYLERLGIDGVSYGAVILRRRSATTNWIRADRLNGDRLGPASDHILRVFGAGDFLAALTDPRALLAERLVLTEKTELERRTVFRDREWVVEAIELSLLEGLSFKATLDPTIAGMLTALDGTRTLGEVAGDIARLQTESVASVEDALLPVAWEMLAAGFLVRS